MTTPRPRRFGVAAGAFGLATAVSLAGLGSTTSLAADVSHSARAATAPVTIVVRLDARGRGRFTLGGGLVDRGRATARRSVVNGRSNATTTLDGANGRLVLMSQLRCGARTGTWRVVSGTLAYARVTGMGTTSGRAVCTRPAPPVTVVHSGAVEVPPVALAEAGSWGGKTLQSSVITFTVAADGRAVTDVLVTRYRYECVRSDGQRSAGFAPTVSRHAGPIAISEDRTFTLKIFGATIAGRFGPARAEGTITIAYTLPPNIQGQTSTCSASIPWTATNPPAPPPRALAGTYCGISAAGGGVCLDVTGGGREIRNVRAEVKLTCGLVARIPLSVSLVYDQPIPFGLDLSFRQSFDHPYEGSTARATVSGTFDESGGLVGTVSLSPLTIMRDGAQHSCRGNGGFTAKLQR